MDVNLIFWRHLINLIKITSILLTNRCRDTLLVSSSRNLLDGVCTDARQAKKVASVNSWSPAQNKKKSLQGNNVQEWAGMI